MTFCYILISFLFLSTIISIYIAYIQRIKCKKYEQLYNDTVDNLDKIESSVESVVITMRNIDRSGAFESDDEVGIIFKSLKEILFKHFKIYIDDKDGKK